MTSQEYTNKDGLISVNYMKEHISEEETNKIWCHPYYELMVIISGEVTYSSNEGITRVTDKSVVFTRAHEVHNPFVHDSQIYERYKVRFNSDFARRILKDSYGIDKEISRSYKKGVSDADFDEILRSVKNLVDIIEKGSDSAESELRETVYLISALICAAEAQPRPDVFEKNYISDVVEHIKNNYNTRITAEELAARFFVSRGKLIYDFKAYCDMTLLEYLTLTRLEAAKEMLLSGYAVSHAAESCGFSSPSYFIKVFSRVMGMTPLKFQTNFSPKD